MRACDEEAIRYRWESVGSRLDERGRRLFAAAEVRTAGWGGLAVVSRITGLARSTINRGEDDLDAAPLPQGQVRRAGGGRKAVSEKDPGLVPELQQWVSKSMDKLADTLTAMGHPVSADTVARETRQARLFAPVEPQGRRGLAASGPRRAVRAHQRQGDRGTGCRAARHLGGYKEERARWQLQNGGTDYRPKGAPVRVNVHDFEDKTLGKVVPYGVYDIAANAGFVSLGITSDTAEFAVAAIRCWLERVGRERYPQAKELTITADCGGSNGARVRLWKVELQKLADETELTLHVHHYPPGTSKWNRIEHRLFCHITQNWRGRPLTDRLAVVELIGATTTRTGLKVACVLDERTYEKGIKVSDAEMAALDITGDTFHPEWNYTIKPRHR
jgi:hypothetical protein